jgi:hypothetical protein
MNGLPSPATFSHGKVKAMSQGKLHYGWTVIKWHIDNLFSHNETEPAKQSTIISIPNQLTQKAEASAEKGGKEGLQGTKITTLEK